MDEAKWLLTRRRHAPSQQELADLPVEMEDVDELLALDARRRRNIPSLEALARLTFDEQRFIYRQDWLDMRERIKDDPLNHWRADMARPPAPGVEDGPARLPKCTTGVKLLTRGCNHNQAIVLRCGKPTCIDCSEIKAAEERARWLPVLAEMKHPKQLVLAVKSLPAAIPSLDLLAKCNRRFMELRLGQRSRARYLKLSHEFIEAHKAEFDAHHDEDQKCFSAKRWHWSVDRFWLVEVPELERQRRHDVLASKDPKQSKSKAAQALKVRHLLYGFRSLEVTWDPFSGFHPHYHTATGGRTEKDGRFLPWPAVMVLWMTACTVKGECFAAFADPDEPMDDGQVLGRTAHISKIGNPAQLIKYMTKHQNYKDPEAAAAKGLTPLPPIKLQELEEALHGRKHIWPYGNAKPAELPKHPCPGCKDIECQCHMGEDLHTYCGDDVWKSQDGERLFQIERWPDGGLTWRGLPAPLLDPLGDCATLGLPLGPPIAAESRAGP